MTEITQEGWKNKALSMLLAQLTSYVLFIAATVIPSPGTVPIIPLIIAALTLAAFVVFWPFRGSILDRIVTFGVWRDFSDFRHRTFPDQRGSAGSDRCGWLGTSLVFMGTGHGPAAGGAGGLLLRTPDGS